VQATKAHEAIRILALLVFNLDTKFGMSGQLHDPVDLPPEGITLLPFPKGYAQSWSRSFK
jgi:hypothetical protein